MLPPLVAVIRCEYDQRPSRLVPFPQRVEDAVDHGVDRHEGAQLRAFMPVDTMVNRVFNALRERHEARRTLVVFTSDNGYQWGEHGLTRKGTPYPASFWVPLLIRWPGHFALSGRTLPRPAANVDIAPTLLSAAGVTANPAIPMDGHSLLTPWTRNELLLEFWKGGGDAPPWASIRTSRYQ